MRLTDISEWSKFFHKNLTTYSPKAFTIVAIVTLCKMLMLGLRNTPSKLSQCDMGGGLNTTMVFLLVVSAGMQNQLKAIFADTAEQRWIRRNDMKIKEVNDEKILFDNGNTITFDHEQD